MRRGIPPKGPDRSGGRNSEGPQRERRGPVREGERSRGPARDEQRGRGPARDEQRGRGTDRDDQRGRGPREERDDQRGRGPREERDDQRGRGPAREHRPTREERTGQRPERFEHQTRPAAVKSAPRPALDATSKGESRSARWSGDYRSPREGEFYIAGLNGVREVLRSPHIKVRRLYLGSPAALEQLGLRVDPEVPIEKVREKDTPYGPLTQGVAALVQEPQWPEPEELLDQVRSQGRVPLLVALDQVEDPMNLGQILRTCEGAGVDGILVLRHRSTHLNQTVAQVSQGAFAWLPVIEVVNLRQTLDLLKHLGLWVVGCEGSPEAQPWHACRLSDPLVLVFGAEGSGLRTLTRKTCDVLASLPMQGHIGSLNVGAAVSAFVYETARQRGSSSS